MESRSRLSPPASFSSHKGPVSNTRVVAAEKLAPGRPGCTDYRIALILLGVAVALRPDLAMVLRASGHSM